MKIKKFLAGIIASVTLSASLMSGLCTSMASAAVKGDANGDGKFDIRDAAYIARYIAKGQANLLNTSTSDYNGDGKIDIRDAASVAKTIAKSHQSTTPSTEGWRIAYKQVVKNYKNIKFVDNDWETTNITYTLYDINKGSTPELIVSALIYSSCYYKIYTWDNKKETCNTGNVGSMRLGTIGVLKDVNKLTVTNFEQFSGTSTYYTVDINGNTKEEFYESLGDNITNERTKSYDRLKEVCLYGSEASSNPTKFIDEWKKPVFE